MEEDKLIAKALITKMQNSDSPLLEKLRSGAVISSPEASAIFFGDKPLEDKRWAETAIGEDSPTGETTIFVNDAKFKDAGAGANYRPKIVLGEQLHILKNVAPERYQKLLKAANNQKMNEWAAESFQHVTSPIDEEGKPKRIEDIEQRPFEEWYPKSRFDQVMGGYLFGGDPDIPSMKTWNRDLPYGDEFITELEILRKDLGLD
tara:strand:+ start:528 stop:1139 length:612 start_codon:yes stop_codon:yes gene_type:complete